MKHSTLITGANGGIGSATARYFLENDPEAFVYLGVRSKADVAEEIVKEFAGRCALLSLDVTSKNAWETAVAKATEEERAITVLVNNAGHHEDALLASMTDAAWNSVIDSNLNSVFLGSRAVLRGMMSERFGRIINIASLSALLSPAGQANYSAAKAGVVAMTKSLAKEVGRAGITANSICPGYIQTEALADMDPDQLKAQKKSIPMRRFGTTREVAAAAFFLANKDAGYITGATLKIDGGIF